MRFVIGFIAMAILLTFMWWLSGFDFDHRNLDVAAGFGMSVIICFICGLIVESTKH